MPEKGVFWEGISGGLAKTLEEIVEYIPGVGHYLKRENARERDKIIREHIAERFDHLKDAVMKVMEQKAEAKSLEGLDKLDRLSRKLDKLRDTIKFTSHGYSGYFDRVKILDEELRALNNYDLDILHRVEEMDKRLKGIREVLGDDDKTKGEIAALSAFAEEMEEILEDRKYAVTKGTGMEGDSGGDESV
jgi:hypothetical protein